MSFCPGSTVWLAPLVLQQEIELGGEEASLRASLEAADSILAASIEAAIGIPQR